MARYYDLDKLSKLIEAKADTMLEGKGAMLYVAKWLNLLPTADVVKRPCTCSECKHFKIINFMTKKNEPALAECQKQGITFLLLVADPKEHFCGYGERSDTQ